MRVQCGQGHWFDTDASETCDHRDTGGPCGYPAVTGEDADETAARIRALLDAPSGAFDPVREEPVELDESTVAAGRAGVAEARAALRGLRGDDG